jgi:hypothetical protein
MDKTKKIMKKITNKKHNKSCKNKTKKDKIKNYKHISTILASNCKKNPKLMSLIKKTMNSKFKNQKDLRISMIVTAKLGLQYNPRVIANGNSKNFTWDKVKNKYKYKYEKIFNTPIDYIDCSNKHRLKDFKKCIKSNSIIWVMGGDTFYLWYHLKKTGMDKLIYNRIKNDNVLYIGCCAGAIIAGSSIFPTYISRLNRKSFKYNLNTTYKKKYWNKKSHHKTMKLVPDNEILPHCSTYKNTLKLFRKNNSKNKKRNIYCLPEYKPYIK